jgi:hypothetical protein
VGVDSVPILQEAGWAPGAVWVGALSSPTEFDSQTVCRVASPCTDELSQFSEGMEQ